MSITSSSSNLTRKHQLKPKLLFVVLGKLLQMQ
jgi:hypothetical protein